MYEKVLQLNLIVPKWRHWSILWVVKILIWLINDFICPNEKRLQFCQNLQQKNINTVRACNYSFSTAREPKIEKIFWSVFLLCDVSVVWKISKPMQWQPYIFRSFFGTPCNRRDHETNAAVLEYPSFLLKVGEEKIEVTIDSLIELPTAVNVVDSATDLVLSVFQNLND